MDALLPLLGDASYFHMFAGMAHAFQNVFPKLKRINQDLLWLHILISTVMYAKYTVEGTLPDDEETEDAIFQLLSFGLSRLSAAGEITGMKPHQHIF